MFNTKEFLKSLLLTAEFIIDTFEVNNTGKIEKIGKVSFYYDKKLPTSVENIFIMIPNEYYDIDYQGIAVFFNENEILEINFNKPEKYGTNLNQWLDEVEQEVSEAVAREAEIKYEDIEDARSSGN